MTSWTKPPCEFCNGSHYLLNQPGMGPCVCASAENLTAAESFIVRLTDQAEARQSAFDKTSGEYGEALGTIAAISDHFLAYLIRLGVRRNATLQDEDLEAITHLLGAWE